MKVDDLDLNNLLSFNPKGGIIQFMGRRVLLFDAIGQGYVSVTPLQIDLTNRERMPEVAGWLAR